MADVKFSAFAEDTAPAITDIVVGLTGGLNKKMSIQNVTKKVQLDASGGYAHAAGQLSYDAVTKTILADTGFSDVRVNIGQESHVRFFNDTGVQIDNGSVINAAGVDVTNSVLKGILADADSPITSSSVIGLATHDVPDQTVGLATILGEVRDFDTSSFVVGMPIYLSGTAGGMTQTRPNFPGNIIIIGSVIKSHATEGIIFVNATPFSRLTGSKSYSFTSSGIGSGVWYSAGFYDAPTADANLTQASTTVAFGTAGAAHSSHAFAVFGGAGTVDTGTVGLRVNGDSFNDQGTLTLADTETLTSDITAVSADEYLESAKKWVSGVTYELFVTGGSPTTYGLDFNYGLAKYEDIGNNDYTVTDFEVVGLASANDSAFDIEIMHHKPTGWTYSAAAFVPGDGVIASMQTDLTPDNLLVNGEQFAWKRDNLSVFVDGDSNEGILIRITTGQNNSVQSMDLHLGAQLEELFVS